MLPKSVLVESWTRQTFKSLQFESTYVCSWFLSHKKTLECSFWNPFHLFPFIWLDSRKTLPKKSGKKWTCVQPITVGHYTSETRFLKTWSITIPLIVVLENLFCHRWSLFGTCWWFFEVDQLSQRLAGWMPSTPKNAEKKCVFLWITMMF